MSDRSMRTDDEQNGAHRNHEAVAALVRQFISMMQSGNIARLELEHGDLRLALRAHEATAVTAPVFTGALTTSRQELRVVEGPSEDGTHVITAPMIGTYYEASAPGEPPFVRVGERVDEGQTVGIIEAMKIMNEIAADRAGMITAILVKNGQTVEYGTALIKLDLAG